MEKAKKFLKNFIFFIILIGITFYMLFKDQDINDIWNALSNVNKWYILIAIFSICGYVVCEALNAKRNLQALEEKVSLLNCIKYMSKISRVIYYSNIDRIQELVNFSRQNSRSFRNFRLN